jgi:hypothetical protein
MFRNTDRGGWGRNKTFTVLIFCGEYKLWNSSCKTTSWMIGGSSPGRDWEFSLQDRVQTGSGAHQVSYLMGTMGSFTEGKVAGAWSWPLTYI